MSCPEYPAFEDRLNDYAGGYLSGRDKQEVDEHLLVCTACRDEVHALKALLQDLSGLPDTVEAPESIWQATSDELHSRLDAVRSASGRSSRSSSSSMTERVRQASPMWNTWMPLAVAAAAVLVAALALFVAVSQPGTGTAPLVADGNSAAGSGINGNDVAPAGLSDFGSIEADFKRAADELMASLESRREQFPPRTLAVIEKNLLAINEAIAETREAMESDPDNTALGGLMRAMYRRKMNLLQGASELPTS